MWVERECEESVCGWKESVCGWKESVKRVCVGGKNKGKHILESISARQERGRYDEYEQQQQPCQWSHGCSD